MDLKHLDIELRPLYRICLFIDLFTDLSFITTVVHKHLGIELWTMYQICLFIDLNFITVVGHRCLARELRVLYHACLFIDLFRDLSFITTVVQTPGCRIEENVSHLSVHRC